MGDLGQYLYHFRTFFSKILSSSCEHVTVSVWKHCRLQCCRFLLNPLKSSYLQLMRGIINLWHKPCWIIHEGLGLDFLPERRKKKVAATCPASVRACRLHAESWLHRAKCQSCFTEERVKGNVIALKLLVHCHVLVWLFASFEIPIKHNINVKGFAG